jgi:hypothetical protein
MAQERYGFFNSTTGDERSYDSADMATALHTLASSGVAAADACLQVTAEGSTMRTLAGYGSAMVQGYYYQLKDDGGGVKAFEHTTEAELDRIDRIILRLDLTARTIAMVKLIGTASSTPEPPALTRGAETWEISLAQVLIQAAAQEILPGDITDERADDTVCGLIAPEALRPSTVEQMISDAVEEATDDVLRFSEQTLETSRQDQARENIDAQKKIVASGVLKGDGAGGVAPAAGGTDFGIPAAEVSATLLSTGWSGSEAPYTQAVAIAGMTAAKKAIVGLPHSATSAQYLAALAALLHVTSQGTDTITVTAEGDVPEIDLPVLVEIVG